MDTGELLATQAPWFHIWVVDAPDAWNTMVQLLSIPSRRVVGRWLRGQRMKTLDALFNEFAASFQFPYYFGDNWPAFDECLADLDWLPADGYTIFVSDAARVLEDARPEDLGVLVRILHKVAREWNEGTTIHSLPPIPFHVVFLCAADEQESLLRVLELAGAPLI